MYDLYITNNVFHLQNVNVICNQLMQGLIDEKFNDLNDHFALSGKAAEYYLTSNPGPIQNVQFKTDKREIYLFIARNLKKICPDLSSLQTYEERLIAEFNSIYFEFYLVEEIISTTNHLGIYTTT